MEHLLGFTNTQRPLLFPHASSPEPQKLTFSLHPTFLPSSSLLLPFALFHFLLLRKTKSLRPFALLSHRQNPKNSSFLRNTTKHTEKMSNKSPIFPMPQPQHFSDYGFDPQIDYFQVPLIFTISLFLSLSQCFYSASKFLSDSDPFLFLSKTSRSWKKQEDTNVRQQDP